MWNSWQQAADKHETDSGYKASCFSELNCSDVEMKTLLTLVSPLLRGLRFGGPFVKLLVNIFYLDCVTEVVIKFSGPFDPVVLVGKCFYSSR